MGNVGKEELGAPAKFFKGEPKNFKWESIWLGYVGCGPIRTISLGQVDPIVRKKELPFGVYYRKVYERSSN